MVVSLASAMKSIAVGSRHSCLAPPVAARSQSAPWTGRPAMNAEADLPRDAEEWLR